MPTSSASWPYFEVRLPCTKGDIVAGMAPPPPPQPVAEVHEVTRDPLVMQVQMALVKLGYLHGGADGHAGPKTAAAIRQFETDQGLTVDGVSSRNLLALLKSAEASAAANAAPQSAPAGQTGGKFAMPPPAPAAN